MVRTARSGTSRISTAKLIELLDDLSEKLKSEAYNVMLKSEAIKKPFEVEAMMTTEQDTWRG